MERKTVFINLSLLLKECGALIGIAVGIYGIVIQSAIVLSIALCAISALCAVLLFVFQYHTVIFGKSGVRIVYFLGTLSGDYRDIREVKALRTAPGNFPLSTYYRFLLRPTGRRLSYMDGEVLKSEKMKYLLLSRGILIDDPKDKTVSVENEADGATVRYEHRAKSRIIKQIKEGERPPVFLYRKYGILLSKRPYGSFEFGYMKDGAFIRLFTAKKRGKRYVLPKDNAQSEG